MKNQANNLREELKTAGASNSEVRELAAVADNLKQLKHSSGSSAKPALDVQRQSRWWRRRTFIPIGLSSITGLALGMALVMLSQAVLPGSLLYPIQELSDSVAVSVNPSYRGTVMMKRAQAVKQLIAEHADSSLVLASLADYQTEAATYKSAPANYAVFDYCKSNLQQAAAVAPKPERQAINRTLSSLQNV